MGTFLLVRPREKLWLGLLWLLGLWLGLALGLTLPLIALIIFRLGGLTGKYHKIFKTSINSIWFWLHSFFLYKKPIYKKLGLQRAKN